MIRQVLSVGGLTLVSRVSGFIRDILMAAILGAGPVADAFFVALRLPNHFRALFAEGAFAAAFVPMFTGKLSAEGEDAARRFAVDVQAWMLAAQAVLLIAIIPGMPWFMRVFAPGFADEPEKFELAVLFTRITFPYLAFIALETLYAGVLNARGRFAAAAAAPVLLNLAMIVALLTVASWMPTAGHALSWAVLVAGVLQLAFVAADAARQGFALPFAWPRLSDDVRRFMTLLGPAALGAGLTQINLFADTLIASLLPSGAVSHLYYADRLNQLPLGVIGIAMGTVLLPEMSRRLKGGDEAGAIASQNRAFEFTLSLALPAAIAFIAIGGPILSVLFEHGRFTAADAAASADTLAAYALGLPAFVLLRGVVAGFYAREDTATPVRVALIATAVNVPLKLLLMGPMLQVGLALATSAAAWVNVGALVYILWRRGHFVADARLRRHMPRLLVAVLALGLALPWGEVALRPFLTAAELWLRVGALGALCVGGGLVFAACAFWLGIADGMLPRRFRRKGG